MMTSESFPLGMRFHPTEEETMSFLLHKVIGSQPLSCPDFIRTADLYGDKEPWELFGDSEEKELYFFTELKKVGNKKTSQRFLRNVGKGTWMNKGQKKMVYGRRKNVIIGYKRCYRYERKKDCHVDDDQNGKWLLKEYILPDKILKCDQVKEEYKDYALCVLKRKGGSSRKSPHVESGFDNNLFLEANMLPIVNVQDNGWESCSRELITINQQAYCVGGNSGGLNNLEVPTIDLRVDDNGWESCSRELITNNEQAYCVGENSSGLNEGLLVEFNKSSNDELMMMPYNSQAPFDLRVDDKFEGGLADDKFEGGERCTDDLLDFFDSDLPLTFPISGH